MLILFWFSEIHYDMIFRGGAADFPQGEQTRGQLTKLKINRLSPSNDVKVSEEADKDAQTSGRDVRGPRLEDQGLTTLKITDDVFKKKSADYYFVLMPVFLQEHYSN